MSAIRRMAYRARYRALSASRRLCLGELDRLDTARAADAPTLDGAEGRTLDAMRSDGLAVWDGFLSGDRLREVHDAVRGGIETSASAFAREPGARERVVGGWRCVRTLSDVDGRTRAFGDRSRIDEWPEAVRAVAEDKGLARVVSAYYGGSRVWPASVMAERLEPGVIGDHWHFDKVFDQVKVMVLLTDVGRGQGPTRYKAGTQRLPGFAGLFVHESFRRGPVEGLNYNYPPAPLVESMDAPTLWGTGAAGDAVVFDTLGLHSGTRCTEGVRDVLVIAFNVATQKNEELYRMMFPERAA